VLSIVKKDPSKAGAAAELKEYAAYFGKIRHSEDVRDRLRASKAAAHKQQKTMQRKIREIETAINEASKYQPDKPLSLAAAAQANRAKALQGTTALDCAVQHMRDAMQWLFNLRGSMDDPSIEKVRLFEGF
jgi:hypothetical protein